MRRSGQPRDTTIVVDPFASASVPDNTSQETPMLTSQSWWTTGARDGLFTSSIGNRIVEDLVSDLAAMDRVIIADRIESQLLTDQFTTVLESPLDTAQAAWDRHTQLILRFGRSIWLFVTPNNFSAGNDKLQAAFVEHGLCAVVFSPLQVTTKNTMTGKQIVLTHTSGTVFHPTEDELVSCSWVDQVTPGETISVLKPVANEIATMEVAQQAVLAGLDNARNQRVLLEVTDGHVAIETVSQGNSEPAVTRQTRMSKATWLVQELLQRVHMSRDTRARDTKPRIPIALTRTAEGQQITRVLTQPDIDGGLVELAVWAREQTAIVAAIPTSQLTGEQPKYANLFATRDQFVRSQIGSVSAAVATAAMPAVRKWRTIENITPKLVLELDPSRLIEQTPTPTSVSTVEVPAPVMVAAADTPVKKKSRADIVALNKWQLAMIKDLNRISAQINKQAGLEAAAVQPVAAVNADQIREWVTTLLAGLTRLRRIRNKSAQPSDLDRANIERAISRAIDAAATGATVGEPLKDNTIREFIATDLLGTSRMSSDQNATLLDRDKITEEFPELVATADEPIEWQWSWTPPGDPGRDPFPDHFHADGVTWFEGEEPPGDPGGDANGDNCQCVIELAVPVEATV